MSQPCIAPEDLGVIDSLAADSPARLHLERCARCQSRYAAYRAFVEDRDPLPGVRDEEAAAALDGLIRERLQLPAGRTAPRRRSGRTISAGWRARLLILAPATAAAVIAVTLFSTGEREEPRPPVLRGTVSADRLLRLESARPAGGEALLLTWTAVPGGGADRYVVRFFDARLNEVHRAEVETRTTLTIRRTDFPSGVEPGARLLCRVAAYRDGEEIAISDARAIEIP